MIGIHGMKSAGSGFRNLKKGAVVALVSGILLASAGSVLGADGFSKRLTIHNNCAVDAWLIETPPGSPTQPAVRGQWNWWKSKNGEQMKMTAGETKHFEVPDKGAPGGNFRVYMGCDASSPTNCIIGAASGDFAGINTLFEPTFGCKPGTPSGQCAFNPSSPASTYPNCAGDPTAANCGPIASQDNYDISAVDGYTIPMKIDVAGTGCNRQTTDASMLLLAKCPAETGKTVYSSLAAQETVIEQGVSLLNKDGSGNYKSCTSPGHWFAATQLGTPSNPVLTPPDGCNSGSYYSCGGNCTSSQPPRCPSCGKAQCEIGPKFDGTYAIENTNWVKTLKSWGYKGYTWAFDDGEGLQQCDWGAQIKLTLCPAGGTPYKPAG